MTTLQSVISTGNTCPSASLWHQGEATAPFPATPERWTLSSGLGMAMATHGQNIQSERNREPGGKHRDREGTAREPQALSANPHDDVSWSRSSDPCSTEVPQDKEGEHHGGQKEKHCYQLAKWKTSHLRR